MAKSDEYKFLWDLGARLHKPLDDPYFEKMNPYLKRLMFELWCNEKQEQLETYRKFGIFVGSFYNPEAAHEMSQMDNPDFALTQEEFDQSFNIVVQARKKKELEDPNFLFQQKKKMKDQKKRRRVIARSLNEQRE